MRVGTAPLPQDSITSTLARGDNVGDELVKDNARGRELAFQLAGKEFRSSKEAMKDKKDEQQRAKNKRKAAQTGEDGTEIEEEEPLEELWTEIVEDDGGQEGDKVLKTDLQSLSAKWGSRLRIRATDDEIYYRLVGQTERVGQVQYSLEHLLTVSQNPRITAIIFHILQITARSRERGITTIELGPATGTSQGSLHYYMKVLTGLGLWSVIQNLV